ncbi:hypothetical protein CR513_45186, partial [Mucuna pruriens]
MWMSPLMAYLKNEELPSDPNEAKKIVRDSTKYIIIGGELYRRGFSFSLLCCIEGDEARYIVREVHEGVCYTHIGGHALASKIAKAGYYWPTLKNDCMEYVKRCDKCQRCAPRTAALHHLALAIPQMGRGHLGTVPIGLGSNYFTKWTKAKPVAMILAERIKRFY